MSRVIVTLSQDERDALIELAEREHRLPRDQARHLIVVALIESGILKQSKGDQSPTPLEPVS